VKKKQVFFSDAGYKVSAPFFQDFIRFHEKILFYGKIKAKTGKIHQI